MTRPQKQTVDYFSHDAKPGKTLFILESKWRNDGYAFWFKLLSLLCETDGHAYDAGNTAGMVYLTSKTLLNEQTATEILDLLANLGNIDRDLWQQKRLIWCQSLVDRLKDVYSKRKCGVPSKPVFELHIPESTELSAPEIPMSGVIGPGNPQSKVKESKGKESTKEVPPMNPEAVRLAQLLLSSIQSWKPDFACQNIRSWEKDIATMLIKGRDPQLIEKIIRWLPSDNYENGDRWKGWRRNILSAGKLREKFDQLDIASRSEKKLNTTLLTDVANQGKDYKRGAKPGFFVGEDDNNGPAS